MIKEQCLTKEWLEKTTLEYKQINPSVDIQLIEKTVNALYLLELLVRHNIKLIFKGGTSLILLLLDIKRLSIDIDIIIENDIDNINNIMDKIVKQSNFFTRYEEDVRNTEASNRMNLKHYKFFYNSRLDNFEKYVLLDIVFEENVFTDTVEKEINCQLTKTDGQEIMVKLPTIDAILGDKFTVIAPTTTGISYSSYKELELMKQLFDIDKLFNECKNIIIVKENFKKAAEKEIKYRKLNNINYNDVLDDIAEFCKIIIYRGRI